MEAVETLDARTVKPFSQQAFAEQQDVKVDGSPTLKTLEGDHRVESQVCSGEATGKWLPWVHIAIANLKRFLLGTYHGVSSTRLQEYLNEFCYRFNRRAWLKQLPNRLLFSMLIHKPKSRLAFSL